MSEDARQQAQFEADVRAWQAKAEDLSQKVIAFEGALADAARVLAQRDRAWQEAQWYLGEERARREVLERELERVRDELTSVREEDARWEAVAGQQAAKLEQMQLEAHECQHVLDEEQEHLKAVQEAANNAEQERDRWQHRALEAESDVRTAGAVCRESELARRSLAVEVEQLTTSRDEAQAALVKIRQALAHMTEQFEDSQRLLEEEQAARQVVARQLKDINSAWMEDVAVPAVSETTGTTVVAEVQATGEGQEMAVTQSDALFPERRQWLRRYIPSGLRRRISKVELPTSTGEACLLVPKNMSPGGVCVETARQIDSTRQLPMVLQLNSGERLRVTGQVCWSERVGRARRRLGIAFTDASIEQQQSIREWVLEAAPDE